VANPFSVRARLTNAFTRLPVTSGILLVAGALYASTLYIALFESGTPDRFAYPGAMTVLQLTRFPEVHGPFDLWEGHVWRLLFNAMHHAGLWHVLLNSVSLWMLGGLLEARMGRLRYLLFFLTAGYVSVLAQSLLGDTPIGMSGAVCAVFGYLIVLRKYDHDTAERMPPSLVTMGLGILVLFVPLTAAGLLQIANLAHFVGLGYGWLLGWLICRFAKRARWRTRAAVAAIHVGIVGLTLIAMHPTWNGRYQAWMALKETDRSLQLERWRDATSKAPDIAIAWYEQARILYGNGQKDEAWKTALKGLRLNRTDKELDGFVRNMWAEWRSQPLRTEAALTELREVFKEESDAWIRRLKLEGPPPIPTRIDMAKLLALLEEQQAPPRPTLNVELDVPQDVAGITSPHPPSLLPGEVNPNALDSALLGETL
jgi:membrane associated rhomboid family serine protease